MRRSVQDDAKGRFRARLTVAITTIVALVAAPMIANAFAGETREALACTAPPPTPTPTEPAPTPTRNPTPTPTSEPVQRFVTLTASKEIVDFGGTVTLTGELTAADGTCRIEERVEIMSRVVGTDEERRAAREDTGDVGEFDASPKIQASTVFWAVAPATRDAAEAVSEEIIVLGRVSVEAGTRSPTPERGTKFTITARVRPEHPGSFAVLQRRSDAGNWFKVKKDKADSRSAFSFTLKANWKGPRVYRVKWLKSDEDHEPDVSNKVRIRTVKPRDDGRGGGGRG
jgi:hypothetical protein